MPSVSRSIVYSTLLPLGSHLAADAEVVPRPGEHQDVDVGIALGEHRRLLDAVVHLDGTGVAPLGTVEDDAQHTGRLRGP
jgi:hypothetical protein